VVWSEFPLCSDVFRNSKNTLFVAMYSDLLLTIVVVFFDLVVVVFRGFQ